MRTKFLLFAAIACLAVMFAASPSPATITIAGIPFDDHAFADKLLAYQGTWDPAPPNLEAAVVGIDYNSYAWPPDAYSYGVSSYLKLAFTDNVLVNGPGDDLAVFELSGFGWPGVTGCLVTIQINGISQTLAPLWFENDVYLAKFNLDNFGVASGGSVTEFYAMAPPWSHPDYGAFGAINSAAVPIPGAVWLLGSGLLGLGGWRRFRKG